LGFSFLRFYKTPSYQLFISKQGLSLILLALVISLSSAFLAYTGKTQALDWLLYDNAMTWSQFASSDDIVIIEIDDKSLSQIGRWPWPRRTHAELLDKLSLAQTKAVVFDVLFPELDANDFESDKLFAQAIKRNASVILPIYLETLGQQGQVLERPPHGLFYREVQALGHVHLHAESDGIIRGVFLKEGVGSPFWPHLSLALIKSLASQSTNPGILSIPGNRVSEQTSNSPTLGIARDFHNLLPMPASDQGLRHYSYSDVLKGAIDLNNLYKKIVFVGATAAGLGDVLATPIGSMNGVELNAWIFQALHNSQMIQTLPALKLGLITFLTVLLFVLLLGRLSPRLFLIFSLLSITGILSASTLLLLFRSVWLSPTSAMTGVVAFFPLWSWLRAEAILRFLREEIEVLSGTNIQNKDMSSRQQRAQHFLEQTGMFDSVTKQLTQKGELAIQTLFLEHEQNLGTSFWQIQLEKHAATLPYSLKKHKGVEVIARTISQLSTIKENDKKNRQLIEKSLSSLQDAVCIADLCGEITFTNERFEQWFQADQSSHALLDILKSLELKSGMAWPQVLSSLYQTNKLFTDEAILKTLNDQQFLCQASLVSINEEYNDTLILTFTDISQLKAAENTRSEALSFLSHDLRSPMVSVLAIIDCFHSESSISHRHLSNQEIHHIESLVRKNLDYAESFLQLSKADSLVETNMSPCDLHAILDAAQVQAQALAAPKSIKVITERCIEDAWVLGDIGLLERALTNLISNAIKFSPAGSQLKLKLAKHAINKHSLSKNGKEAQISVEDQGLGIDKQDQKTIFDRFTRLKSSEATEGVGLGLNFVATVVKKHQGEITLTSELNVGSSFMLHIPALSEQELFDV
jgi:CHASE2 domain-containing sensor protein/signal transduction histidine kinase